MRLLTPALLEAQLASRQTPYVRVQLQQRIGGVTRLRWTRLYTGAEDDFYHAATVPADGSLIRARVSSGGQLYLQRTAAPGPGSDFSSWTALGAISTVSAIALTSGSTVLLCYVDADQRTIKVRESSDNGASFGAAVTAATAGAAVGWLAAGVNPGEVVGLFFSVGAMVYRVKRTAGAWGSAAAWPNTVASISGLACVYRLDWDLAITGADSGGQQFLWTCIYGDGYAQTAGTWSGLTVIDKASAGANVDFKAPFLDYPDVFRMFYVQRYTGSVSYTRPYWAHTPQSDGFAGGYWREPVPFDLTCAYGVALAHDGGSAWLSTPFGVWQSPLLPPTLDITPDVLELTASAGAVPGRAVITLRNDHGLYGPENLSLGAELSVAPGFVTRDGPRFSSGPAYWVESWDHHRATGAASVTLHAVDGWGLLERWRASRLFAWDAGAANLYQLLAAVVARAGLTVGAISLSSTFTDFYPAFAVQPGEDGRSAVERLLAMAPDCLYMEGAMAYLVHPQPDDAACYSYGEDGTPGQHRIWNATYRTAAQEHSQARVHGKGVFAEAFDWSQVGLLYGRPIHILDQNLTAAGPASDRAAAALRRETVAAALGELVTPVNCGQQPYDVIAVNDPAAGQANALRRVTDLTFTYRRTHRPAYELRLRLGGV